MQTREHVGTHTSTHNNKVEYSTLSTEVLGPTSRQGEKEGRKWGTEQGRQELYGALAQGLQGLQKTLRDGEELQRARTTRCLQLLAQEIRDRWVWARGRGGAGHH